MPTSGSSPRSNPQSLAPSRGFSLLELLVVLGLISVMTALVAPRLSATVDAISASGERAEIKRQLERLPMIARDRGQPLLLPADRDLAPELGLVLPAGWQVRPVDEVHVAANGLCTGGKVRVTGRETVEEWAVSAPDCSVDHGE